MSNPKPAARERLIGKAAELFQAQGYHCTGLNQILDESRAPKGSLYYYFPGGKEELACAAIDHAAAEVAQALQARCAQAGTAAEALACVLEHFAEQLQASQFQKGCPIATISLEAAAQSPRIREACARAYALWQTGIAALLQGHGLHDAAARAELLLAALEGALLLCRVRHDCLPLKRLQAQLIHSLEN